MQRKLARRSAAMIVGLGLVGAACGSSGGSGSSAEDATTTAAAEAATTTAAAATTTAAEAATTTAAAAAGGKAGALEGFKGTTPLVKLSDEFQTKLKAVDPKLTDVNYAAETYDAIVVIALATEEAKSDGIEMASKINGITKGGEKCTSFKACLDLIKAGKDVDYDGVSGPIEFNGNGEPLSASYGVQVMGANNQLDDTKTTYKLAKAPASAAVPDVAVEGTRKGDGELKIGSILPQTGSLAFLGPPEFAAFDLAIKEINEAGGVLGKPVVGSKGDSGDATTDTVNQTTDRLLGENVDAIIGAASSGVSLKVIDKITAAGVVQFSPANTSDALSTYPDKGLYFRTAPPDVLQGAVIGDLVVADGAKNVAIIARNDAYGTGLAGVVEKAITDGGGKVVYKKIYDEKQEKFTTEAGEIKAASPDAIVVIGFDESSKILAATVEAGIGPKQVKTYGCDGNIGNALGKNFNEGK